MGELGDLSRLCTACGEWFQGAWMPHAAWHCPFMREAWSRPDAVAAKEWADRVPWDVADERGISSPILVVKRQLWNREVPLV